MRASRGEMAFLILITVGPTLLLLADVTAYDRSASVLAVPAVAAALLLTFGVVRSAISLGRRFAPVQAAAVAEPWRDDAHLAGVVLMLLAFGPRVGLPVFGLVFARALGASWFAALATCAICAALVEFMLVRLLGHPLPWLPIVPWLGI